MRPESLAFREDCAALVEIAEGFSVTLQLPPYAPMDMMLKLPVAPSFAWILNLIEISFLAAASPLLT